MASGGISARDIGDELIEVEVIEQLNIGVYFGNLLGRIRLQDRNRNRFMFEKSKNEI